MKAHDEWLNSVKKKYDEHLGQGGFQVLFPSYRPDMSKALANHLGLKFYDYRQAQMESLAWEAAKMTLDYATSALLEESAKSGLVVHNIESLLATKPEEERKKWLEDFLGINWPHPVVLPISVYQGDTLEEHQRVCDIELIPFAKESFIMRLAM